MSKSEKRRNGWELASSKTSTSTTKRQNQFAHSKRDDVHPSHIDGTIQDESSLDMTWLKTMRKTLDEMLEKDRQKELDSSTSMEKEEVKSVDNDQSTFYTRCTIQSKVALVMIDERRIANVASTYSVEKLGLTTLEHPKPYTLQLEDDALEVQVTRQVKIPFSIGTYQDEVLCDVASMKSCHLIFGKPWKDGRQATKDQKSKKISFVLKGKRHQLIPMATNLAIEEQKKLQERIDSWEKECIERDDVKKQESKKEEKQSERRREEKEEKRKEKKEKREKLEIECEEKMIYIERSLMKKESVLALEKLREKPSVVIKEKGKERVDISNSLCVDLSHFQDLAYFSKGHQVDVEHIPHVFDKKDFFCQDIDVRYCTRISFECSYSGVENMLHNLPSHKHWEKQFKHSSIVDKVYSNAKWQKKIHKCLDVPSICSGFKCFYVFEWQGWVCFIFDPGILMHDHVMLIFTCWHRSYTWLLSFLDLCHNFYICSWSILQWQKSLPNIKVTSTLSFKDLDDTLVHHDGCAEKVLAPNFCCAYVNVSCAYFSDFSLFCIIISLGWFYLVFDPGI